MTLSPRFSIYWLMKLRYSSSTLTMALLVSYSLVTLLVKAVFSLFSLKSIEAGFKNRSKKLFRVCPRVTLSLTLQVLVLPVGVV